MLQKTVSIEINEDFERAIKLLNQTKKHLFITGKAGTGKSTLLQYFRENTKKQVVVLAPTGVAALNVKGQTIHSFFKFPPHVTPETLHNAKTPKKFLEMLRHLETIVIDEVSMVRADMMDNIDIALRFHLKSTRPFGGLQMIFIGDLYQLPPVVTSDEKELFKTHYSTPYFFSAEVMQDLPMEFVELEKIYRQKDSDFIELLNKIRNNSVEDADITQLNKRFAADFDENKSDQFYITLTTTNAAADELNQKKLSTLKAKIRNYSGSISGNFDSKHLPTAVELDLKIGAQVMMLNNDTGKRWVNGSVGKITDIQTDPDSGEDFLIVKLNSGQTVEVSKYTWEVYRYLLDKKTSQLNAESIGSFTQYPIRLAWAVTIHKSQGKTFDNVVVDIGRGTFTHGQVYVAISRCTSFEGLILRKPILKQHIWMDLDIVKFVTQFQYQESERQMPIEDKISLIESAIESGKVMDIVYLKANDSKSRRSIKPVRVGPMTYLGKTFPGLEAYCMERRENRTFRVDRILQFKAPYDS